MRKRYRVTWRSDAGFYQRVMRGMINDLIRTWRRANPRHVFRFPREDDLK